MRAGLRRFRRVFWGFRHGAAQSSRSNATCRRGLPRRRDVDVPNMQAASLMGQGGLAMDPSRSHAFEWLALTSMPTAPLPDPSTNMCDPTDPSVSASTTLAPRATNRRVGVFGNQREAATNNALTDFRDLKSQGLGNGVLSDFASASSLRRPSCQKYNQTQAPHDSSSPRTRLRLGKC